VAEIARAYNLALHIDGARIFNAAAAQNVDVKDLTAPADSVMFCLSKGLASPIGSMLVGTHRFIKRARHVRKMLGGGMRQVGVIAAAGIISLEKMTLRLNEDHVRAKKLAEGLRHLPGIVLDEGTPYTNMVYFNLSADLPLNAWQLTERLKELGVLVDAEGERRFRLVTHYWIDDAAVDKAVAAFAQGLG
jgi:threonine aldolase